MASLIASPRAAVALGGLIVLLIAERVRPFRPGVESRARRYLINFFIMGSNALLLSVLLSGLLIAAYQSLELEHVGLLTRLGIGPWANVACTLVFLDGVTYFWHRAYHGLPLLWRMHRVHHSDRDLDVTTSGRFHLTEMVLSAAFRLTVIAAWGASLAAVIVFEIVFGLFNQLEHANVQLPEPLEGWARLVFVTPAMHRIHHSQVVEETNANYGTIFSCWDRLFGTYRFGADHRGMVIGLPEYTQPADVTLGKVLAMPFGPPCGPGHQLGI